VLAGAGLGVAAVAALAWGLTRRSGKDPGELADGPAASSEPVALERGQPARPPRPPAQPARTRPLATGALVPQPAGLPDVRTWTIATRLGRRHYSGLAFHPTDGTVAVGNEDRTIRIYDVRTGQLQRALVGSGRTALAWSPDGQTLAAGGPRGTVQLWDRAGRVRRTLKGHTGSISSLSWSPDGTVLASGSADRVVRLWRIATNDQLPPLKVLGAPIQTVAFSPDGTRLACNDFGTLCVWEKKTGKVQHLPCTGNGRPSLAWSPDGTVLAFLQKEKIKLLNIANGRIQLAFPAHAWRAYTVAFAPDGKRLASTGHDGAVHVWDRSGKRLRAWRGPFVNCSTLTFAWSPEGQTVAYTSWEGLHLCAAGDGVQLHHLRQHGWSSQFLASARVLVTPHDDGTLRFWDVPQAKLLRCRPCDPHLLWQRLACSPNGKLLAVANDKGPVRIEDLASGRVLHTLPGPLDVTGLAWLFQGKYLAVYCRDGSARIFAGDTFRPVRTLKGGGPISRLAWGPAGNLVAAGSNDRNGVVRLWNLATGDYRALRGHRGAVRGAAFSPDGKLLASAGKDTTVRLWDVATGRPRAPLEGHTGVVNRLMWLPDRTLVSASEDGTVRLWDTEAGKVRHVLTPPGRLEHLLRSPDGQTLAAASAGRVRLFAAQSGKLVRTLGNPGRWPIWVAWPGAGRTLVVACRNGVLELWNPATGRLRCTLVNLRNEQGVALSPDGHFSGTPWVERELVCVVRRQDSQETLAPEEFARRFGWKNDPTRVRLDSSQNTPHAKAQRRQEDRR
jgi:WD40 repeat protein